MIKNLYRHRQYLFGSFWADFRYRYAGTALGIFWFIVNPLLDAFIYTVIFSQLMQLRTGGGRGISYTIFLLAGLFPWLTFSRIITVGSNSLNAGALYLRRLAIPPGIFIAKDVLVSLFSFFIYILVLIPINLFLGHLPSWHLILIPAVAILFAVMGFGMSLILGHLRVFFPDIAEVLPALMQLWRWTLPINFSQEIFPEWLRAIMQFNPPYYFILSFRSIIIDREMPQPVNWIYMMIWALLFFVLGSVVTRLLESDIRDQM
jgi:lipopolysaccharide transport system permease protein